MRAIVSPLILGCKSPTTASHIGARPKSGLTEVPNWDVMASMLNARETLSRFGSLRRVSDLLGVKYSTVLNWPERGIPHRWRWRLVRKAEEVGVSLSEAAVFGDGELSTTSLGAE